MKTIFETPRFLLREITEADAQNFFELDSDPDVHIFLGNRPVKHIQESEAVVTNILEQYKKNGLGRLAIIDKSTNEFIGWSGLKFETGLREEFDYYDLGYRLKKQYWGRGIATETSIASLKYGFETLGLDEICAAADVAHGASNRILQKVGLELTGTFIYAEILHNWHVIKKEDWLNKEQG